MKRLFTNPSSSIDTLTLFSICFFSAYFLSPLFSIPVLILALITELSRDENKFRNLVLIIFIFIAGIAIENRDTLITELSGDFFSAKLTSDQIEPLRNKLSHLTNRSRNREFLKALTTGKREFSAEFRSLLINSGTMHLVAISAFHVGVVFIILNLFFFRLIFVFMPVRPRLRQLSVIILKMIFSAYYFYITGGSIPTLRAITFILFFEFFLLSGAIPRTMTIFLISLTAVSVLIPASASSLSFVMSAICVATVLNIWRFSDSVTIRLVSISVLINYALLPVTCDLNGCFSLSAAFINLLIIPLMFLIIPVISLAQFGILFSSKIASFFLSAADFLLDPLMFTLRFFSDFSEMTLFPIITPSFFIKICFIATFFTALLLRGNLKKAAVILNISFFVFFLSNWVETRFNPYGFFRPDEFFSRVGCVIHEDGTGSIYFDKYRYNPQFNPYFYNNLEKAAAECRITEVKSIHFSKQVSEKIKKKIRKRIRFRNCVFYSKNPSSHPEKNRSYIQVHHFSDPFQ